LCQHFPYWLFWRPKKKLLKKKKKKKKKPMSSQTP
jgi:hypothetical protein